MAAHLKIHSRRMQDAADCSVPGAPRPPPATLQLLKTHSAAFDSIADKLYAPFLTQALTSLIDEAAEQVATDLRTL